MKKILSLLLAVVMILSLSIPAFAAEVSDGTTVVKTWENDKGETVTGIITKDTDVLAVCTTPEDEDGATGFIMEAPDEASVAAYSDGSEIEPLSEVSDYFYFQIYNSRNQVVAKYKITLTGKITAFSRKITTVTFKWVSGDVCQTEYSIDGNSVYAVVIHPEEGYLDGTFTLNWDGTFTVT